MPVDGKSTGSVEPHVVVLDKFTKLPVHRIAGTEASFSSVFLAINEESGGSQLESAQDLFPKFGMRVLRIKNVLSVQ